MKRVVFFIFFAFPFFSFSYAGCLTVSVSSQTNLNCFGDSTGSVQLTVVGGTSPYTYTWSTGSTSLTGLASGLPAGAFGCTITDAGSCRDSIETFITGPAAVLTVTLNPQNASCGKINGSVSAAASGGSIPYTYSWSDGGIAGSVTGLSPSGYTLTVTDTKGCSSTSSALIVNNPGPVPALDTVVNPDCFGGANGYAVIVVSSGTPAFTFNWSTGLLATGSSLSDTLFNLTAGSYSLDLSDANGCFAGIPFTVGQPSPVTIAATATNGSCGGPNGAIALLVSGGAPVYTFIWSTGDTVKSALPTTVSTNLLSGNYSVAVVDSKGCSSITQASLDNKTPLSLIILSETDVSCSGKSDGSVDVQITSGTPSYTFYWSEGVSTITGPVTDSSVLVTGLAAGTYTLTVQDHSSCSASVLIVISEPFELTSSVTYSDASCGNSNGLINAGASGGTSPYFYIWSNDSVSQIIRNLSAGNYRVTVTDKRGCTSVDSASIANTSLPVAVASAQPSDIVAGSTAELSGNGGSSFQWLPGLTVTCSSCPNTQANPLQTTTYTLVVTDNFGCSDTAKVTVTVKPACIGNESDVFVANVFSPNGDGKNDVIKIEGNGLTAISWSIFDRWGNLLFYSEDQANGWDGTSGGKAMGNGTYIYILQATCIKTQQEFTVKGTISILK